MNMAVALDPTARATSIQDRKSTRLNSSHRPISYAAFCLQKQVRQGYERLTGTAPRSQDPLRRLLAARKLAFTQYWLVNTILVRRAHAGLVSDLSARADCI